MGGSIVDAADKMLERSPISYVANVGTPVLLLHGDADVMLSGGTHTMLHALGITGFNRLTALSTFDGDPKKASRPFDATRDGMVPAEGAALLVIESMEHAINRGATILAEILGHGVSSDAFHAVQPDRDGSGAARAIRWALEDAEITSDEVDYINAHGTSTPAGDMKELQAIKQVFNDKIPLIGSTKSLSGHALGAAGVNESIYSLLMLENDFVAESVNIETLDEEAEGMPIVRKTTQVKLNRILSNSFGFGGTNACLVFERFNQ